jgi:hypothetical protein
MEKYNLNEGNESLKRILLMMNYDNKKTLSENVEAVNEQANFDYDILTVSRELKSTFNVKEKLVLDILKKYTTTKESFCNFLNKYKELTSNDLGVDFGSGFNTSDKEWKELSELLKPLNIKMTFILKDPKTKRSLTDIQGCGSGNDSEVKSDTKDTSKPSQSSQGPETPQELKNPEGVKKFQDWLDRNKKGWATGYSNGVLNKQGRGYGRFGPRTQKAWNQYKDDYLSGNINQSPSTSQQQGAIQTDNQFIDYENEIVDGKF